MNTNEIGNNQQEQEWFEKFEKLFMYCGTHPNPHPNIRIVSEQTDDPIWVADPKTRYHVWIYLKKKGNETLVFEATKIDFYAGYCVCFRPGNWYSYLMAKATEFEEIRAASDILRQQRIKKETELKLLWDEIEKKKAFSPINDDGILY